MFETWYGSLYPDQLLSDDGGGGVAGGVGGRRELERLFVCPSCFRYGREVLGYIGHLVSFIFLIQLLGVPVGGRDVFIVVARSRRVECIVDYIQWLWEMVIG